MKKYFTREQVQEELEKNILSAQVSYMEREDSKSPDNYIVYYRISPSGTLYADDKVHIKSASVQVTHFHKKKLDSIETMMAETFGVQAAAFDIKQVDTDYYATYFKMDILTGGDW